MTTAAELIDALRANVARHGSVLVAFSGGIDSTLVLKVAADVLGERAVGLLGTSPSVPPAEERAARELAEAIGARLRVVPTHEMRDPDYVRNPVDRCFHCKSELYARCRAVADAEGLDVILNGTNADDPGDWRPGLVAAERARVGSPLLECGLGKEQVRVVARHLGLPNWEKPALACLASRIPHGTPVTIERLRAVDAVEIELRALGFRQVRARHRGEEVHLEVEPSRVAELEDNLHAPGLQDAVRRAGFLRAVVTREGYAPGRLNDPRLAG